MGALRASRLHVCDGPTHNVGVCHDVSVSADNGSSADCVLAHEEGYIAATLLLRLSDPGNFDLNDGWQTLLGSYCSDPLSCTSISAGTREAIWRAG
jgi:hypothetical protein